VNWKSTAHIGLISTHELPDHFVREYSDRLAIWRRDGARLGWEEIQAVKCLIWGDRTAVEVYPPPASCVNLRHTRHLWWSPSLEASVREHCRHPEFDRANGDVIASKLDEPRPGNSRVIAIVR